MKIAKPFKILVLFTTFILSIFSVFMLNTYGTAKARMDYTYWLTPAEVVTFFDGGTITPEITSDNLVATITEDNQTVKFDNTVLIDGFTVNATASNIKTVKYTFTSSSYLGKYSADTTKQTVVNEIIVNYADKQLTVNETTQNVSALANNSAIKFTVANNLISATVEEITVNETNADYKVAGEILCVGDLTITFTLNDATVNGSFAIGKIKYNGASQYFIALEEHDNKIDICPPAIMIDGGFKVSADNEEVTAIKGEKYTFDITVYPLIGSCSNICIAEGSNIWVENATAPKTAAFYEGATSFIIKDDNFGNIAVYNLALVNREDDESAPVYTYNEEIVNVLKEEIENATTTETAGVKHSIRLGNSITIPSDIFALLVSDNYCGFSDLTHTIYYKTPTSDTSTTSNWTITPSKAGDYEFYVIFKDVNGNSMESDYFYTVDEDDSNVRTYGAYKEFIFTFHVEDDAPLLVSVANSQGKGYLDTKYIASAFTIEASGYTPVYTLYYNANANALEDDANWVKIIASSKLTDEYENDTFDYDEIEEINYDGKLTFTPTRKGAYKIECSVSSTQSVKTSSAATIIKVEDEMVTVKPASHWLAENIWSVVFLAVGTLCLIGIIVLLFIKPKEVIEDEE